MGGCGWLAAAVLRSGVELSLLIRLGGWVVGILESNAKLNSKLRLKLKFELSLAIFYAVHGSQRCYPG